MNNTETILHETLTSGACAAGVLCIRDATEYETERMAARRTGLPFCATYAVVAAFPFFSGDEPGNMPLYARGLDYVQVNLARLEAVRERLSAILPDKSFYSSGNAYPLPAVQAARIAGVGKIGVHGLLIVPGYGSHVTIGAILTDLELEPGVQEEYCNQCGLCVEACPTGALRLGESRTFVKERCRAWISEQKELTPEREALFKGSEYALGCDICQRVCPENRGVKKTELAEYMENLIPSLTRESAALVEPNRKAYTYKNQIIRNIGLMSD